MHPGGQRIVGDGEMGGGRRNDRNQIDFGEQFAVVDGAQHAVFPGDCGDPFGVGICHSDQRDVGQGKVFLGVEIAEVTHSDHSRTQFRHRQSDSPLILRAP